MNQNDDSPIIPNLQQINDVEFNDDVQDYHQNDNHTVLLEEITVLPIEENIHSVHEVIEISSDEEHLTSNSTDDQDQTFTDHPKFQYPTLFDLPLEEKQDIPPHPPSPPLPRKIRSKRNTSTFLSKIGNNIIPKVIHNEPTPSDLKSCLKPTQDQRNVKKTIRFKSQACVRFIPYKTAPSQKAYNPKKTKCPSVFHRHDDIILNRQVSKVRNKYISLRTFTSNINDELANTDHDVPVLKTTRNRSNPKLNTVITDAITTKSKECVSNTTLPEDSVTIINFNDKTLINQISDDECFPLYEPKPHVSMDVDLPNDWNTHHLKEKHLPTSPPPGNKFSDPSFGTITLYETSEYEPPRRREYKQPSTQHEFSPDINPLNRVKPFLDDSIDEDSSSLESDHKDYTSSPSSESYDGNIVLNTPPHVPVSQILTYTPESTSQKHVLSTPQYSHKPKENTKPRVYLQDYDPIARCIVPLQQPEKPTQLEHSAMIPTIEDFTLSFVTPKTPQTSTNVYDELPTPPMADPRGPLPSFTPSPRSNQSTKDIDSVKKQLFNNSSYGPDTTPGTEKNSSRSESYLQDQNSDENNDNGNVQTIQYGFKNEISFNELKQSIGVATRIRPASRSNKNKTTPVEITDSPERINELLGDEFYNKHSWISRTKLQFHPSQYKDLIASMGSAALEIIETFPKWFNFLFPAVIDDRKNYTIKKNGKEYVSTSVAYRRSRLFFINRSQKLEVCPICCKVITHKYLVVNQYIEWKEDYGSADILNWQLNKSFACYIHWRSPSAIKTPERNPYKCPTTSKPKARTPVSSNVTDPQLGPAVLPLDFI